MNNNKKNFNFNKNSFLIHGLSSLFISRLSPATGSATSESGDTETGTTTSEGDTESLASSSLTALGEEEPREDHPRQQRVHHGDNGSVSGYSVHSSEYAPDWKSSASSDRSSGRFVCVAFWVGFFMGGGWGR